MDDVKILRNHSRRRKNRKTKQDKSLNINREFFLREEKGFDLLKNSEEKYENLRAKFKIPLNSKISKFFKEIISINLR